MVVLFKVPYMGKIELFNILLEIIIIIIISYLKPYSWMHGIRIR